MNNEPNREKLFNYLLGEISETAREEIEDRLFTDDDFADVLDDAENDLIDEYVRGNLSNSQKLQFEKFFLISARRREKVRLAETLIAEVFDGKQINNVTEKVEKITFWESLSAFFRQPNLGFAALALAILAVLLGGFWLLRPREISPIVLTNDNLNRPTPPVFTPSPTLTPENSNSGNGNLPISNVNANRQNENRPANISSKPEKPSVEPAPKPSPKQENKPMETPKPTLATILLTPMIRSGDSPKLKLAKEIKSARLQFINTETEIYQTLRLEIVNPEGVMIYRGNFDGKRKPKSLTMQIPAAKLINGDYEITLSGAKDGENFTDLNYYRFSVQR